MPVDGVDDLVAPVREHRTDRGANQIVIVNHKYARHDGFLIP